MSKPIDLTGNRYGKLVVIARAYTSNDGSLYWKCLCDCGNTKLVRAGNLRTGAVKSCGCLRKEIKPTLRHNMTGTRIYSIWAGMKNRCYNKNEPAYKRYGGRGIRMCNEWKDVPDHFFEWAYKNGYTDNLTIERIDVDGDYCPENCTWIPRNKQQANRSYCRMYTYNGKTQNLTQWCYELGIPYKQVHNRINKLGWSFERSISEPCHIEKRTKKGR